MTNLNKQPIGFNQELKVSETEIAASKKKSSKAAWIVKGAIALGMASFIFNFVSNIETPSEMMARKDAQHQAYKEEKAAKMEAYNEAKKVNDSMKESHTGSLAVASFGKELTDIFNKELKSTSEYEIFKPSFSIVNENTLVMTVDIDSASSYFGTDTNTTEIGISQGSDAYRPYLKRFDNRMWNGKGENLVLQIQDNRGKVIVELTK